jgi:hypothetical protein
VDAYHLFANSGSGDQLIAVFAAGTTECGWSKDTVSDPACYRYIDPNPPHKSAYDNYFTSDPTTYTLYAELGGSTDPLVTGIGEATLVDHVCAP